MLKFWLSINTILRKLLKYLTVLVALDNKYVNNKNIIMIYTNCVKTDSYYEFTGNGKKLIVPATNVIIVDDNSGMKAIKLTTTRKTIGLLAD